MRSLRSSMAICPEVTQKPFLTTSSYGPTINDSRCLLRVRTGVCPIAEFSQTLIIRVGSVPAGSFYLTNRVLSAFEALQLGLAHSRWKGLENFPLTSPAAGG